MKKGMRFFCALMTGLSVTTLATSCATSPVRRTAGVEDFQLRPYQEETLPNGLRLIFIQDNSLPRISLQMMISAGVLNEPSGQAGVAALTFGLLDKGTKKHEALALADAFAGLGAEFEANAGADMSFINAYGISPSRDALLKLYQEVIVSPTFRQTELNRLRAQYIARLQRLMDEPQAYADLLLDETVFGTHPYARSRTGTISTLKKITRADVEQYYRQWLQPKNAILAVVGQFDDSFRQKVRESFSQWKPLTPLPAEPSRPAVSEGPARVLVSKKDLKQTQIRIGELGIRRADPDFMRLRMATLVLGGAFASRLNQRVRDDLGLTYSIHASSDARLDRGSLEISTFTRNEKAAETLRETEKVIREFVDKGATPQEVEAAKALLLGQFPAALETPDRLANNLMILRRYGISDDYLRDFHGQVNAVSVADVNEAARRHLHPDQLKIVVYADQEQVGAALKGLGDWQIKTPTM